MPDKKSQAKNKDNGMKTDQANSFSPYQLVTLFALTCLNMQDGFDILAISYAANVIAEDWGINRASLGIVLSAGLFGMMLGAMILSPFADKIGRKPITILGLALSGAGMLVATFSPSISVLMFGRVLTGLGVGAILASLNTLVAELAGERYRGQAIAIFQLGFPLGAFLSGFVVAWLLDIGTWRHIFAFGALTSFLFIPIVAALPESMDYLAKSGRPDALLQINRIRAKLRRLPLKVLPTTENSTAHHATAAIKSLFTHEHRRRTLLIWTAFFLVLTTLYFLLSWTPKLLIDSGFSDSQGNQGGRLINLVGMGGIILVALVSRWIRPSALTSIYLIVLSILLVAFGSLTANYMGMLIIIGAIGFVIHGSMIGLYATTPALYPPEIRATGMGWAIGLSRFGAVIGPASAGFLLELGWSPQQLFQAYAIPAILGSMIVFALWREERKRMAND
jgi:benzoate transport